jgi:hypothetical protein
MWEEYMPEKKTTRQKQQLSLVNKIGGRKICHQGLRRVHERACGHHYVSDDINKPTRTNIKQGGPYLLHPTGLAATAVDACGNGDKAATWN